jgi:protein TonB
VPPPQSQPLSASEPTSLEASTNGLDAFRSEGSANESTPLKDSLKSLQTFSSEASATETPQSSTIASPERPLVSLAALQAAGITFDPDEAVAIVQALCRVVMTAKVLRRIIRDSNATNVSSPVVADAVFISAAGRLSMTADEKDELAAIRSVGKILSDILPDGNRLFLRTKIVSKALASPPQFGTLDELSQALEVYERPNRKELIQALYERWSKLPVPATAAVDPIAPETIPPASIPHSTPAAPSRSGHRAAVTGVAIGAAIAIIVIGGWLLLIRSRPGGRSIAVATAPLPQQGQVTAAAPEKAPEPAPLSVDGNDEVAPADPPAVLPPPLIVTDAQPKALTPPSPVASVQTSGWPKLRGPVARVEPPAVAARPRLTRPAAQSLPPAKRPEAHVPSVSRTNDAVGRTNTARTATAIGAPAPASASAPAPSASIPLARSGSSTEPRPELPASRLTYSAQDADVTPPMAVDPQLLGILSPSSPGVRLDSLTIAVVVNENGAVDSVRAVTAPQTMSEFVLVTAALSAVKSWHFRPATKDGAPVRFRQIVPVRMVTRPER